jgi:alkylation response protein AidB-like acyl-CoA dehydrogenase
VSAATTTRVDDLLPMVAARAAEIENGRRVPRDLLDELKAAGCFRLLVPTSHGGSEVDLLTAMRLYEDLASADASVAWIVMIGGGAWCDLVTLPRATFDAVFAAGPDVIVAGAFNPSGSITPVNGGYRVEGRWGFASGCEHADWVYANCVEGLVDGHPQLRAALLTPDDVVIEDTWTATGLCATASHHFHVDDLTVAAERTFVPLEGEPCIDAPIARIPTPSFVALTVSSVALGVARGALDDLQAIAHGKVPMLDSSPLSTNPLFQRELAVADTELRAARGLVHDLAVDAWAAGVEGRTLSLHERARVRAAAAWATDRATRVVDTAHRLAGSTAVYAESPLQRRLRDIHTLTQHFIVKPDTLTVAGAVLAGLEPAVPVF